MWRKRFSAHSTSAFQLYASLSSSWARTHIRNSSSVRGGGGGGRSEVVGIPLFLKCPHAKVRHMKQEQQKHFFVWRTYRWGRNAPNDQQQQQQQKQEWKEWCTPARKVKGAKLNSAIDWKQNWRKKKKGSIKRAASIATVRIKRLLIRSNTHTHTHKYTNTRIYM